MEPTTTQALAARFAAAIRLLAAKPENLDNMECYLVHHFRTWVALCASCPENLTAELERFANMKV